ncbi:MAG: helicase-exonuclease AddAB subunit AddA [Oscillospiraceae bacterium]|nr:helicase-exonuclease AddAB subunit AddA [Oscillospiraceae bacterium]
MPEIVLTKEQRAVVENRGGALLVSAAAGSGKTKVLIDRVLKRTAEERCNLDDFLMITFTQAAAAELRGKLLEQLGKELAKHPEDRHLQGQMSRVYLAQISTVHSFCNSILREYAHFLGLPPDFSLCDEQRALPLRRRAMDLVLERAYRELEEGTDVEAALTVLGMGRNDERLPDLIWKMYGSLQSYQDVDTRLEELKRSLSLCPSEDLGQTVWGSYLIDEFHAYLRSCLSNVKRALDIVCSMDTLQPYGKNFSEDLAVLQDLLRMETWEEYLGAESKFSKLSSIKNCTEPEWKDRVQKIRSRMKEGVKKYLEQFQISSREAIEDMQTNGAALRGLLLLTEQYAQVYTAEKRRRHLLDYNDLEHEALRLLLGKNGQPSSAAREISLRYVEIMVDEYQDTNAVQDAIFRAVSRQEQNLFFVGDVKQSIYGFRQANPAIFLEKYKSFKNYENAVGAEPRKILLSDNFRSHPAVLSAATDVFRLTMTERVGGLYYGEQEALRANCVLPDMLTPPVELHCISTKDIPSESPVSRVEIEAEFVAQRIAEMLQTEKIPQGEELRSIQPEDIVILFRAMSGAPEYMRALSRRGIAAVCAEDHLFESEEIVVLHSLLELIDNPHQDIPLLSVLLSPLICFSTETLAKLRGKQKKGTLYEILETADEAASFVQTLTALRDEAQSLSLRELLEEIDEKLFLRNIYGAMEGGSQRRAHLERLFAFADTYEAGGNYGLPGFLRYLESLREKGLSSETPQSTGAVRLMSVHKSKGLEFPVVFLADLSKKFNLQDASDMILIDSELGIASKVYDEKRWLSYPTVASRAISQRKKICSISEEMRILYVAMTRAKYRLVMTCCSGTLDSKLKSLSRDLTLPADEILIESAASMADWILMTALTHTEAGELFAVGGNSTVSGVSEYPWRIKYHKGEMYRRRTGATAQDEGKKVVEKLPYLVRAYDNAAATQAPTKLTATQLKGRTLDQEISEGAIKMLPEIRFSHPRFEAGRLPLTAAEKGTAIHLAMQFIRYENCSDLMGVEDELKRLLNKRFLTAQQVEAVDAGKILAFFRTEIGKRVQQGGRVVREFKFSILDDAATYDGRLKGEEILIQGVTDCCLLEDDGLTVLDFKSDRITPGGEKDRTEYYRGQLDAYSRALGRIFDLPVKERILYFFATDTACSL